MVEQVQGGEAKQNAPDRGTVRRCTMKLSDGNMSKIPVIFAVFVMILCLSFPLSSCAEKPESVPQFHETDWHQHRSDRCLLSYLIFCRMPEHFRPNFLQQSGLCVQPDEFCHRFRHVHDIRVDF